MKTITKKNIFAVASAITLAALVIGEAHADTTSGTGSLIYNSRAYAQVTGYGPNPMPAQKVENAQIIYVNNAYGPAIYSYPSPVSHQATAFNVEYVDSANGQAIYSYPNTNPKHHLKLMAESDVTTDNVIPAAFSVRAGAAWFSNTAAKP
jgi:hypothetical protein